MRVTLQPGYILHSRPFNETSVLLDVLTQEYGRVHLLARGVRSLHSRRRGLLRSFIPLLLSWSGKTDLMSLTAAEIASHICHLEGAQLINGLYLNELLVRLLPRDDSHPKLFMAYQQTLQALHETKTPEPTLRLFEKMLLQEMGYGLEFHQDIANEPILKNVHYHFLPGKGFVPSSSVVGSIHVHSVLTLPGKALLALHHGHFEGDDLRWIKQLMRLAITGLLGNQTVKSRELFLKKNHRCESYDC